jgi:signal transduction histidine kinase
LSRHVERDVPDSLRVIHRLRQVLTNIINNAIKFTETGEVVLRVALEEQRDRRTALRFSVRDTGIGIPKARQSAIFEAFMQADGSDTRRFGGTGLGLTIAAQLVGLMGGRLWVDSEEGCGSTFSFVAWFDQAQSSITSCRRGAPQPPCAGGRCACDQPRGHRRVARRLVGIGG